jgi:hypothetical protein
LEKYKEITWENLGVNGDNIKTDLKEDMRVELESRTVPLVSRTVPLLSCPRVWQLYYADSLHLPGCLAQFGDKIKGTHCSGEAVLNK